MDPDSCLLRWTELCDGITVMPLSLGAAFALLLALALLYTSGFVSASEIAFFSLSPSDLNDIEEENHPYDSKIKALLDDSERLLATILISNNFVNVTIIMLLIRHINPGRMTEDPFQYSAVGIMIQTVHPRAGDMSALIQ